MGAYLEHRMRTNLKSTLNHVTFSENDIYLNKPQNVTLMIGVYYNEQSFKSHFEGVIQGVMLHLYGICFRKVKKH